MEIKPCENDIISAVGIWPVIIICEIFLLCIEKRNSFFMIGIISLDIVLCFFSVRDLLYLSRSIRIDHEGCTFSIGHFSRKYSWESTHVLFCDDSNSVFSDSDIRGAGIMICTKEMGYNSKISTMTFCRTKHPLSSVYIRFTESEDTHFPVHGKTVYYGYTAKKAEILEYINQRGL